MNKIILATAAALVAIGMTPAANASVSLTCPSSSGLGYCTFDEVNGTGNFGDSFPGAQSFTDNFTLILTGNYQLSVTATNTAATGGPISFTVSDLLDNSMASLGTIAFGAVPTTFMLTAGTYHLHFAGNALKSASYSGTIDIAPIPEPATWAMMVAGIAAVGVAMRRRARNVRVAFS